MSIVEENKRDVGYTDNAHLQNPTGAIIACVTPAEKKD
jgi:hypothetical protein